MSRKHATVFPHIALVERKTFDVASEQASLQRLISIAISGVMNSGNRAVLQFLRAIAHHLAELTVHDQHPPVKRAVHDAYGSVIKCLAEALIVLFPFADV